MDFFFGGWGGERGSRGFQGGSEGNQSSLTGFKDGAIEKSTAKRVLSMTSRYRGAKKKNSVLNNKDYRTI